MVQTWILSDSYKLGGIDLTASPQAIFTVNSTYTTASNLVTVEADETSGGGYARPNLTVQSNAINSDGYGEINYVQFSLTASGGNITYDRIALAADGDWVAFANFGTTQTLTSGNTATFEITFTNGESGATITGSDGQSAFTTATFGFAQPAIGATVAVTVGNSDWLVVGAYCAFSDGANLGFYEVTAIGSATAVTLKNLGYGSSAAPATAMAAGGLFVPSGIKGEDGAQFETFTGAPATFTPSQADFIAIKTDVTPNLFYRTTGATPGALSPWGSYQTFTGDPGAYTPTTANILYVRTDASPNLLYRSTGLTLGALQEIGGAGGCCLEGFLVLNAGTSLGTDEIGIDGPDFSASTSLLLSDFGRADGFDWSTYVIGLFTPGSIVFIQGKESGAVVWLRVTDAYYLSGGIVEFDNIFTTETGTFLDGEPMSVSVYRSPVACHSDQTGNFSLSSDIPLRYFVDCSGGGVTATVPTAASAGKIAHLIKVLPGATGNTLTISRSGSDLLEGGTSLVLVEGDALTLHSDGASNWWIS